MIEMESSKVVKKETMRKTSSIAAIQVFSSKQFIYSPSPEYPASLSKRSGDPVSAGQQG
jgi:hypothetical protein